MQTLVIEEFQATYRLAASALAERRRFDRILREMLSGAIEDGLEQANISPDAEICIRDIFTRARVRRSDGDSAVARSWSDALVSAILRAAAGAHVTGVVRYQSRIEALIDLAAGVALSDSRRSWAWKQLGLWSSRRSTSDYGAVRELEQSLIREAPSIVAVLCALDDVGLLERLASKLSVEQWTALAGAALEAAGANANVLIAGSAGDYSPEVTTQARRIIRVARLARWAASSSLRATSSRGSTSLWRAVAGLALLEVDPGAVRTRKDRVASLLAATAALMESLPKIQESETPGESGGSSQCGQNQAEPQRDGESVVRGSNDSKPGMDDECGFGEEDIIESSKEPAGPAKTAPAFDEDCEDERPVLEVRTWAVTQFGGLLLLLGLVEELGLPDELAMNPALSERAFRWLMHQLGLAIVPAFQHDPAALAFAGLVPGSDPPSAGEASPTIGELEAIAACAERLVQRLKERVEEEEDVVRQVCWRRAEIVADPGWIEVRFSLDEVRTDIRRAGLDIDPGFLPWLGVAVKFKYE